MKFVRVAALLVGAMLLWSSAQPAQAQVLGSYGSGGFANPGFFGYLSSPYASGRIPTPPYFSIHPPVYYSAPVPRSYGYSPYAYPGTVRTPDVVMEQPQMIENPHVKPAIQSIKADKAENRMASAKIIVNPFARQNKTQLASINEQ